MTKHERRIERAQLKIMLDRDLAFFAPAALKLPVEIKDLSGMPEHCQTAYTDGERIVMHPGFIDKLTEQQLVTLICHEVCHPMLGHLWRIPPGADPGLWNEAADHAVNLMLKEFGAQATAQGLADPFPFPSDGNYCADPAFTGMAEESIYARLGKRPPGGQGGKPNMPAFGGFSTAQPNGQPHDPHVKNDWAGTLLQCAKAALMHGELPAGIARVVGELISPKVPWVEILRSWLRERYSDDFDWMRPAVEYDDCGLIVPSLYSERIGRIVFCVDTSGSIDHDLLAQFKGEMQGCLDDLRPEKLVEICCDSQVHAEREYSPGDTIAKDAPGGGGTSFVPALKRCCQMQQLPKCIVYLTDLEGDFGKDPEIPIIWVAYGGKTEAPFGEVISV